jgi:hypothetical protein
MADQIQDETAAAKADEAKAELELNTTIAQPEEQAASTLEIEKRASQINETGASESEDEGNSDKKKEGKLSPRAWIKHIVKGFDEMIEYMDFSFEMAFQQKDNEFMLAYREHIKMIQEEINRLKVNSEDQRYM